MPIISTDIQYRLSGGASNANPVLSLGGVKSSFAAVDYFDVVSSAEASAGSTEYRIIYVHNAHPTLTMIGAKTWIQTQTPSGDTSVEIGVGASGVNGTEAAIATENTAPAGVTFSAPSTFAAGIALGDIPPGQHRAICVKRIVNPGAAPYADSFTLRTQCDTNP